MNDDGEWLVVTGSSAGGIEALSRLLGTLRRDFPAPIVVAQHLDPHVNSSLSAILTKSTALDVVSVTATTKMSPGIVYVAPPNRNVEIHNGSVSLHSDGALGPKPSVDVLFATAAESYGERLVAVVLTGMGSDGSAGARAVKQCGGTVMIQDPVTAHFPSMPGSLSPSLVDIVAPLEGLARELEILLSDNFGPIEESSEFAELLKRIQTTSGVDFSHYKIPTIKRRLARQIRVAGMSSLDEYLSFLERTPDECGRLVASFFIKVTEFFRDGALFAALKATVIPAIVSEARTTGRELRFWSAGCATGEEAYSLAITLAEILGDEVDDFRVRIFSTDVDDATISFARRGLFSQESLANLAPELVARYFTPVDDKYEVGKIIRNMTVFGQHDLAQRAPFPRVDLVLCRNVLIYFSKELQLRTLQLFAFSLRKGGYLALGKAETSSPLPDYFKVIDPALRIFRRIGERAPIPQVELTALPVRPLDSERLRRHRSPPEAPPDVRRTENESNGAFLMGSSIGFVSIDRRYDISTINAAAREMLNIHGVAIGDDLVHLLPIASSRHLRTVFDAALRGEEPQTGGEEIEVPGDEEPAKRYLTVNAYPRHAIGSDDIEGVNLLVVDVTELVHKRHIVEARMQDQTAEVLRLRETDAHIHERQRTLVEANRQLATANTELRARTDSLLIGAEEATASSEEIETLNEEMQATNEELETLNEEFQATIEELNTTNDELESRGVELQDLIVVSESRRLEALESTVALQAMVDAFDQPMAAVDEGGSVAAANRSFATLQALTEQNAVVIADESGAAIPYAVLLKRASAGEAFSFTYQVIDASQTRLTYRGTAVPLADKPESGGLLRLQKSQ